MPVKTSPQFAKGLDTLAKTLRPEAPTKETSVADFSDVYIATPLSWDHLYKRNVQSMSVMRKHGARGVQIDGDAIDEMRNVAVAKAREEKAKWLLFIDADMVVPEDTLERLLAHDKPIVGGLCRQRKTPHAMCIWKLTDEGWPAFQEPKGQGLHKCDATGAACLLISMEVFDAIDKALPHLKDRYFLDGRQIPGLKPQEQVSEDLWFCAAARAAGYTVHVDLALRIGHLIMGEVIDSGPENVEKGIPEHSAIWRLE